MNLVLSESIDLLARITTSTPILNGDVTSDMIVSNLVVLDLGLQFLDFSGFKNSEKLIKMDCVEK